jgi:hypothetical protein
MYETARISQADVVIPERLAPSPAITLTELAGCIMVATACADMWLEMHPETRAVFYIISAILGFSGGGFKPRVSASATLFFVTGGLYILKALLCPPVPNLVKSDIRNILVGFALLATLGLADLSRDGWQRFQIRLQRTVLVVGAIGAVLGLAKLLYYNQGGIIFRLMDPERGYPLGTSLVMDYNFYALPLLLGLVTAFWLLKRDLSGMWRAIALLCLPALILAVLLSGSRRGLIAVVGGVPILTAWLCLSKSSLRQTNTNSGIVWKAGLSGLALAVILCVWKLDSIAQFIENAVATDSFNSVMNRWETFETGTYSDSRLHYWGVALERFSRLGPLDYLLGEGFGYVTDLGAAPDVAEDYPHNFLLSSMLYGGVLQTGFLLLMISLALSRLVGKGMIAAWFVLVILFLLTSCNSFFSSEMAIFLTIFGLGSSQLESAGSTSAELGIRGSQT